MSMCDIDLCVCMYVCVCACVCVCVCISALYRPGFGPKPGPTFCGPGLDLRLIQNPDD